MKLLLIIFSVLQGILGGDYNAQTLSDAEQDSILNGQSTNRYSLECENEERIFRRSRLADWFVLDSMRHTRKRLGEGMFGEDVKVRDAVMSPNGRYVAFAKDNNLYIHKLDFGTEVAVTKSENTDIISGIADWLYEEEFGTTALFAWSPDSKKLAFVRLDETEVPAFAWQNYLDSQYPTADTLRYPKAGCANAKASVCVYDVPTKGIQQLQVNPKDEDVYFPRLCWTDENTVMVLQVNRDQTKMEVFSCNAKSTVSTLLYKEDSKNCFVDYSLFDEWHWLSDGRFIALSEKDGWRRAYLYDPQGLQPKALTPEGMDLTAVYAFDETTQTLYYQAAPTPATRQIYAVNIKKGEVTTLSEGEGTHSARFSEDGKRMIECFHSFDTPNTYTLYTFKGAKRTKVEVLEDNAEVKEAWQANALPEPELLKIPNGNGQDLEAMLLKSQQPGQTCNGQQPLIVMHYSGPQSQRVLNRWRKRFEYALVEQGYAVLIVDPRGSDCRGRAWRNETYMGIGVKEAEDLIAAAQWAAQRDDIDGERMALLGWSYGGYQTLFTMSRKNHPFKAGIAIAPVTDWKLYDSAYTERYMRRPQVNDRGYREASLLPRAADLTGNVLIIHGTGDDNVHVQHTMQYINALVLADKQFEMQLYPDDNHHLRKGNNASHMHERVLLFLQKNL
jgi:dipeptidyl-peptidase-4